MLIYKVIKFYYLCFVILSVVIAFSLVLPKSVRAECYGAVVNNFCGFPLPCRCILRADGDYWWEHSNWTVSSPMCGGGPGYTFTTEVCSTCDCNGGGGGSTTINPYLEVNPANVTNRSDPDRFDVFYEIPGSQGDAKIGFDRNPGTPGALWNCFDSCSNDDSCIVHSDGSGAGQDNNNNPALLNLCDGTYVDYPSRFASNNGLVCFLGHDDDVGGSGWVGPDCTDCGTSRAPVIIGGVGGVFGPNQPIRFQFSSKFGHTYVRLHETTGEVWWGDGVDKGDMHDVANPNWNLPTYTHNCVLLPMWTDSDGYHVWEFQCLTSDTPGIHQVTFANRQNCEQKVNYAVEAAPTGCNLDVGDYNLNSFGTINIVPAVTWIGSTPASVTFTSNKPAVVSLCNGDVPGNCPPGLASWIDGSEVFRVNATPIANGDAQILIIGQTNSGDSCVDTSLIRVDVANADPWWQIGMGSGTALGSLDSTIPASCVLQTCDPHLITQPTLPGNSTAGIAVAGGSTGAITSSTVSALGYVADGSVNNAMAKTDFDYFYNKISGDALTFGTTTNSVIDLSAGWQDPSGYRWIIYNGASDAVIDSGPLVNLANSKVILFVKGHNLSIESKINLDDGEGFLAVFVEGNITIDPAVGTDPAARVAGEPPDLEGIFLAKEEFITGTRGPEQDDQLLVRGSVAALGKPTLQRDLSNNTQYPAEVFQYAPDLALNFPKPLSVTKVNWMEVEP